MQSLVKKRESSCKWLSSTSSKYSLSNKDLWMSVKCNTQTSPQIRCFRIWETIQEKIVKLITKFLEENWEIKKKGYRELKCFYKNQWLLRVNLKDLRMTLKDFRWKHKSLRMITEQCPITILTVINWESLNNKPICSPRRKSKSKQTSKSMRLKNKLWKRLCKTKRLSMQELKEVSIWKEMISNSMLLIWEEKTRNTKKWKRSCRRLNLR